MGPLLNHGLVGGGHGCLRLTTKIMVASGFVSLSLTSAQAADTAPLAVSPIAASDILQALLGLVIVVGIILLGAWLLRRVVHLQMPGAGAMRILGGLPLGARERIVLVQVGQEQLVIGVAPGRIQTLHVLAEPLVLQTSEKSPNSGFAQRLMDALKQGRST